jgi:hypothetical protein
MIRLQPTDALALAISRALMHTSPRTPGAVVSRLSADIRRALVKLTSEQAQNVRIARDHARPPVDFLDHAKP